MIFGIGNDIVEVERIEKSLTKYGQRFLDRVFTKEEVEYCQKFNGTENLHYAARFAAKEAFSKAVGTGFAKGFKLNEFGIVNEKSGEPVAILTGDLLKKYGKYNIFVTLSHSDDYAIANVLLEG
ncbi:MAG: holo-[acyl-carrier-protein] synthase [Bacteroidetes bacterium 4572_77]|nr:MAG: holo-[acyl-carrier-protein] synthase [Bacteroidetes bacterium 4572_77]